MPINKIKATGRGKAAVAAAVLAAASSGWTAYVASRPDPAVAAIHAAIDKGLTPPAVDLAAKVLIKPWEGLVSHAHWDTFAKKYDICYGDTLINGKPVTAGMSFTAEQCLAILKVRLVRDYYLPLVDGVKDYAIAPVSVQASMLSGAYNFGVVAAKNSSTARFVTKHEYFTACIAQTAFNKAGKGKNRKVVQGLVNRRENGDAQRIGEAELCVSGLDKVK
ncbi:glycoside hydrolase [Mesorhizobium sp. M0292]|uniref:glycoside hydrolase family protein n=1 Tax=Mesorhizobium sp. M0292 TaxID=2956929 RepID=UPI00333CF012